MHKTFNVCLISMSAKPFHAGHSALVKKAASECDIVQIYTTLTPRGGKDGEALISPTAARKMWECCAAPTLGKNVEVEFVTNPISAIYAELKNPVDDTAYHIYGGEDAIQKSFSSIHRWTSLKLGEGVILHAIDRQALHQASGTRVRQALFQRDFEMFKSLMPDDIDKTQAWQILLNN